jgi:cyclopropane-fatty-acyl-phospholipid synthase
MNHGITAGGMGYHQIGQGIGDFIEKYIFPGGELLHVSEVLHYMGQAHLELVDAENLRPHYAKTLWSWSDRLEDRLDQARAILEADHGRSAEKILQAYRLYLAGCAVGFERSWTSLYQLLAIRNDASSDYPFTRHHLLAAGLRQCSPANAQPLTIGHAKPESVPA